MTNANDREAFNKAKREEFEAISDMCKHPGMRVLLANIAAQKKSAMMGITTTIDQTMIVRGVGIIAGLEAIENYITQTAAQAQKESK